MSDVAAIIVAAGKGIRMGTATSKQYLQLRGQMILVHTLKLFETAPDINQIVLVVGEQEVSLGNQLVKQYGLSKVKQVVAGGKQRSRSVYNGLTAVSPQCSLVVVHDGVRPFLTLELLAQSIAAARQFGAVAVGVPVKDTIKMCDQEGLVINTPPRGNLWAIQTPQVFQRQVIWEAYRKTLEQELMTTDDAGVVEYCGWPVKVIMGDYENIKITTPEDLDLAERILERRENEKNAGGYRF